MKTSSLILSVLVSLTGCSVKKPDAAVNLNSTQVYSEPVSADATSWDRLKEFYPVVDKVFKDQMEKNHYPGVSFGIIANGQLLYANSFGFSNLNEKTPATTQSLFRIASMSKSFTAMAILKLRDEGKLGLHDPVSKYIPEMTKAGALTSDAPVITIQNLLTMSAGFPEDNPWGDRQLADTDDDLLKLVGQGISFSNVPGVTFEYSNLGFALLGKIVTNVSGVPYQRYITENVLKPLGMTSTQYEYDQVSKEKLALGYRWEDETWKEEPMLHDGSYGAMGGMICSIEDFYKYVALHLAAWPPRNGEDTGPIKRSSIREMHQPWRFSVLAAQAKNRKGEPCPVAAGYGYGLSWRRDCTGTVRIAHSGGLPGFGSEWRIYPEFGIGVVSFSNRTYGAPGLANSIVLDTLIQLAGLKPRTLPASEILKQRKDEIVKLIQGWDPGGLNILAENFFLDLSLEKWKAATSKLFAEAGAIVKISDLEPENQLRGSFTIECEKKSIEVFFTLTPEANPLVQQLDVEMRQ